MPVPQKTTKPRSRSNLQFGIRSLLLLMLLTCVLAAGSAGVLSYGRGGLSGNYVVFLIAAPMGLMVLLSLLEPVVRALGRLRHREPGPDDDPFSD